jgi:RNA polymerase sigma factor (sigma-70 family)
MSRTTDDTTLVAKCLAGEADAWDTLIERYGRLVYSIPRRAGLPDTDCDDIFQIVFGIVLRRLDTLREFERLSAWLIRTTHRETWRLVKRRKAASGETLPETLADEGEPTPEQVSRLERQHLVRQALEQIDERCRTLLEALFFEAERPDYDALGRRLNMPVGSIGPTRARCFQKLERLLAERGL